MKPSNIVRCAAGVLMIGVLPQAYALGTTAGTDVTNTASVDFAVGGVNQLDVTGSVTFETDRRINVTVAEASGGATNVVPGSTNQVLTFTVTNGTNQVQDFRLFATNDATGATTAFGDTDSFNPSGFVVRVESGANAGYLAAEDTADFIDELAADATTTVYIVSSIANTQVNGDTAGMTLTAVAAQSTDGTGHYVATPGAPAADAAETNTGSTDDPAFVDTVFGDATGDTDGLGDGRHSDDDEYDVVTATITVTKSSVVISDPINGATNPKAIPGAVIEYCMHIANTGSAAADTVIITDSIPANTTYEVGSIRSAVTGTGTACTSGTGVTEDDDTAGADETDPNGGDFNVSTAGAVTVRINPSIAAAATSKALFRVTINN